MHKHDGIDLLAFWVPAIGAILMILGIIIGMVEVLIGGVALMIFGGVIVYVSIDSYSSRVAYREYRQQQEQK